MSKSKTTKKSTPKKTTRTLDDIKADIIEEAKKITTNEVSSCYGLVTVTRELLKHESLLEDANAGDDDNDLDD